MPPLTYVNSSLEQLAHERQTRGLADCRVFSAHRSSPVAKDNTS